MLKLRSWLPLLALVFSVMALSVPAMADLVRTPNYYTSHDGEGHVIRMDEFYTAFKEGQIPVRWSKRLYFGYGYPFFNFNYPSAYYLGMPFMALGGSATDAMKYQTIVLYVVSGVAMLFYLRRKVTWPFALLGSVLYLYAPYRLLNVYVRGSVAESAAFLFPPLLLWCAELIAARKPKAILVSSLVLFLLGISHNISALLMFGFFFAYIIVLAVWQRSVRIFAHGVVAFLLGLCMSAFFFVPALMEKKLTFLDDTIAKDYPAHFVYLVQFVRGGWDFGGSGPGLDDGLSFNLGWVSLGVVGVGLLILALMRNKLQKLSKHPQAPLVVFSGLMLLGAVFFMLPVSKVFWDTLPLLPFVQFPWRFIMLTVPVLAVLSAVLLAEVVKVLRWPQLVGTALSLSLVGTSIFFAREQWHINMPLEAQTVSGDSLLGTTTWADEQATRWLQPKPSSIPDQRVEFVSGEGSYTPQTWLTGRHEYTLTLSEPSKVIEHTMYYPGWMVEVDGQKVAVNYEDPEFPGRLVFTVPAGTHQIRSTFTETPLRLSMDILSLVSFAGVVGALAWPMKKAKKPVKKK